MENRIILTLAGLVMLGMAWSCGREEVDGSLTSKGSPVHFSALTSYETGTLTKSYYSEDNTVFVDEDEYMVEDGPVTKTTYTGVVSEGIERIDWIDGDKVRIYSPQVSDTQKWSDFDIVDINQQDASITPSSGNSGLHWGERGEHTFFAMYPSPSTTGSGGTMTENVISGSQIATPALSLSGNYYRPDMNRAYMYATATVDSNTASEVELHFKPMFTALEFNISNSSTNPMVINSIQVTSSSVALTGSFTGTVSSNGTVTYSGMPSYSAGSNNTITANFPTPISIANGQTKTVTLLALPQQLTNLTVTIATPDGDLRLDLKHTVSATTTWVTVPACDKLVVNLNPPLDWTYVITGLEDLELTYLGGEGSIGATVQSYRQRGSIKEAVPFHLEFSEDGTTWTNTAPDWLTFETTTYPGSVAGLPVNLTMAGQTGVQEPTIHTLELRSRTPKTNMDLSTIDVATGETVLTSTANCYVVQAPGTYKFPLVYGNAIKNGETNESAYVMQGTSAPPEAYAVDVAVLPRLLDHLGNEITSPYIKTQLSDLLGQTWHAQLLWMDEPDLVQDVALDGTGDYITFSVPVASIHQGNALLALFVDDTIVWSWHIWVTDEDMTHLYPGGSGYQFAPVNIGWCDAKNDLIYDPRSWKVRAVQESGASIMTSVEQIKQTEAVFPFYPNNPYFQHQRKDPIQAGTGHKFGGAKPYYPPSDSNPYYPANGVGPNTIAYSIQNPYKIVPGGIPGVTPQHSGRRWQIDPQYINMWNTGQILGADGNNITSPVYKSIYDPSPVGFMVPHSDAFSGFSSDQFDRIVVANTSFTRIVRKSDGLTFPFIGNGGAVRLEPDSMGTSSGGTYSTTVVGRSTDEYIEQKIFNAYDYLATKYTEAAFSLPVRSVKEYRPE